MLLSILTIDASKNGCGWAFGLPSDRPICGVERLAHEGDTDDDVFGRALVWMASQMTTFSPAIVAIEAPIKASGGGNTNPSSQGMLLGLQGVLRAVVKRKLPGRALLVPSQTARKTFTGRGTFPSREAKDFVQAEVVRRGWLSIEDMQADRADALCLWGHMAAQQIPELAFNPPKLMRAKASANAGAI